MNDYSQNYGNKQQKKVTFDNTSFSPDKKNAQRAKTAGKSVIEQQKTRNNSNFQRKSKIVKD